MPLTYNDEALGFAEIGAPAAPTSEATPIAADLKPALSDSPVVSAEALAEGSGITTKYPSEFTPDFNTTQKVQTPEWAVTSRDPQTPSVMGAAARQENLIVAGIDALMQARDPFPAEAGHDPWETVKDDPLLLEHQDRFIRSRSAAETEHIAERIRSEQRDRETLEDAGWAGTGAMLLAGILDPTMLIPIGGTVHKAYRAGKIAAAAGKEAARVGGIVGGLTAAHEVALQGLQYTRPVEQSAAAIGGSIVLGALLGAGASGMASRQFLKLADDFEKAATSPLDGGIDQAFHGDFLKMSGEFQSAGAAKVLSMDPAQLESAFGLEKAVKFLNPALRTINSPIPAVREAAAQFGSDLRLTRNAKGQATAGLKEGGAVFDRVKYFKEANYGKFVEGMHKLYGEYFFGDANTKFAAARGGLAKLTGRAGDRLSFKDFKVEAWRAAHRGDTHDNPLVAKAAKLWRDLSNEIGEAAVREGLLDEAVFRKGAGQAAKSAGDRKKPKFGSSQQRTETQITRLVDGIQNMLGEKYDGATRLRVVDAIMRSNPEVSEALQRKFAQAAGNVTDDEVEGIRSAWTFVDSTKGAKPGQRLVQWIKDAGGIKDEGGDLLQILGSHKARPGLMNSKGANLDDVALRAWEQGFITTSERPTINDLLELIDEDLRGNAVVRSADSEALITDQARQEALETLELAGVAKAKSADEAVTEFVAQRASAGVGTKPASPEIIADLRRALDETLAHPSAAPPAEPTDFSPQVADDIFGQADETYVTRTPNKALLATNEGYTEFHGVLVNWLESRVMRAGHVLKRLEAEGAPAAELESVRKFAAYDSDTMGDIAAQVIRNMLSHPDGRIAMDLPAGARGALKTRTLRMPTMWPGAEKFWEQDLEVLARRYLNTTVPDIELTRAFGDREMTEAIARINDQAHELATDAGAAEGTAAYKSFMAVAKAGIDDLIVMRDRVRGMVNVNEDPSSWAPRTVAVAKNLNYLRFGGGFALSSVFTDAVRPMMTQGVKQYFNGLLAIADDLKALKLSFAEARKAGTAWDVVTDTRSMAMADITDDVGRYSKFERAIQSMKNNYGLVSLMAPWNGTAKRWVGVMAQNNMLEAILAVADGKATQRQITNLAASNISDRMARTIAKEFRRPGVGSVSRGSLGSKTYLANTDAWNVADPNVRLAQETFRSALNRDIDRTIITPSPGDKPVWTDGKIGQLASQFKSYGVSSVTKLVLAGMQERDAAALSGVLAMIAMGMVTEGVKRVANGREMPTSTDEWIINGIDRSGVTGILFELDHISTQFSGGAIGLSALMGQPPSRYAGRNVSDAILGPTAGLVQDMANVTQGLSRAAVLGEPIRETDIRALRRASAYQNLFYVSWLFRQLEASAVNALDAVPAGGR
jgi:hypothetical protein